MFHSNFRMEERILKFQELSCKYPRERERHYERRETDHIMSVERAFAIIVSYPERSSIIHSSSFGYIESFSHAPKGTCVKICMIEWLG